MSVINTLVYEIFLKNFKGKRKKKQMKFLTIFYIFHESNIKNFLKYCSINKYSKIIRQQTNFKYF